MDIRAKKTWSAWLGAGLLLIGPLTACDVVNPGQIMDADLDSEAALPTLVNGMHGELQDAYNAVAWRSGPLFGELAGAAFWDDLQGYWRGETDPVWSSDLDDLHSARWVAEDGIRRMQAVLGTDFQTSPLSAEAHVWAGFANRLLGDTFCEAVIDGGPAQPREAYYQRAEEHFSNALTIAREVADAELEYAALGGRASVRANLGDWAEAVADARLVPDDFVFNVLFHTSSTRERNLLWLEHYNRQNSSVKYTWFEDYYAETGDPRVPSVEPPPGAPQLGADGQTPHLRQAKYPEWGSDIPLTKGAEMRLIEAESLIREGQWEDGMEIINALRTEAGVDAWSASDGDEAFEHLLVERAIVLWMEARRGGDIFRAQIDPADDPILGYEATVVPDYVNFRLEGRASCFPLSDTVRNTNPNA